MTIPAGDNWCSSCQEVCHDHPRICTVCGTTLTSPPNEQQSSSQRTNNNNNNQQQRPRSPSENMFAVVPDHLVHHLRDSTQQVRALTRQLHAQVASASNAQQELLASLVRMREEFQAIPAELLDPNNNAANSSNNSRPTAQATLRELPRIRLESTHSLFRKASVSLTTTTIDGKETAATASSDGAKTVIRMQAVPGEFGDGADFALDNATIIVAEPRTGKGGELSEATRQAIERAKSGEQQQQNVVVYLQRGDGISFVQKAILAQRAGAQAAIIGNNLAAPWPYIMRDSKNEAVKFHLTIPVVMVKQSDGATIVSKCSSSDSTTACSLTIESLQDSKDCVICTESFQVGQTILQLPFCGHQFHEACAVRWLERHNTCPYCRRELPTDDAEYEQERRRQQRTHAGSGAGGGASNSTEWNDFYG